MKRDREVHGLMKIPAEVVISELRQELGKSNAMIVELQDELTEAKNLICDLISGNTNKALQIVKLNAEVETLTAEVKRQQKANTKLMRSIYKLKHNTP